MYKAVLIPEPYSARQPQGNAEEKMVDTPFKNIH